ncbi:hypothetical protein [Xanthomonas euvesicatoria]|uniref:hypothetical protein n=1 Tax=Xanthomonas euvesicatoria TaxID=456327 RepID=UPI001C48DCAD|nr:hypothetical protein [Xanthomonas euvesicatoria]
MPAPVSAPLPARVVTPPASARPAGMTSTQPSTVPEPTQDDAHAAMAPPPPPAPITANNDDVQASGAPAAGTDNSAPAPRPTERAPAPAAAAAAAAELPVLPAPSQDPSLRIERMAANAPATTELVISRNTSRAAPTAAPAPRPEPQAGTPQPGASRDSLSSTSATRIATQQAQQQREQTHRVVSLKLSTPPSDWLADRAASGNTQTPITIRILAATPNAAAVQTWAAQLRNQLKQRGRPTQIELAQDSTLAADELRLELSSAAP